MPRKPPSLPESPSKRARVTADLWSAIRDDPADDGPRQVYADVLSEAHDPRGEFITMQLARAGQDPTPEQRKRELALLGKHIRLWMGELASVAGKLSKPNLSVGPVRDGKLRFERGFLASCSLKGSRSQLAAIAEHPELATVEEVDLWDHASIFLERAELPALDQVSIHARYLASLLDRPVAKQVKTLALWDRDLGDMFIADLASCETLSALHTLRIYPRADHVDAAAARVIRAALALPQIHTMQVELAAGGGSYVRAGKTWTFTPTPETPQALASALGTLTA